MEKELEDLQAAVPLHSMKVGIMQPYFMPYIGYFQLMNAVDRFVVYDNIEYTKKGWINRNRYFCNGKDKYFTIPLQKDSDFLTVDKRKIFENFDRQKLLNQISAAYKKAAYFSETMGLFEEIILFEERNLFKFIFHSLELICKKLDISTQIIISSQVDIDHHLKGKYKVLEICRKLQADTYINPVGGNELYSKKEFKQQGIDLLFLISNPDIRYAQFDYAFIDKLSILDVLMFNSIEDTKKLLDRFTLA